MRHFLVLALAIALSAGVFALSAVVGVTGASAQFLPEFSADDEDARMLLESDELIYNVETGRVTALGQVFIHYKGYQLFANEVTYDQASDTLSARGGARLEEPDGNIVIAKDLTLSNDFKDGFMTGLRADTIFRTRLAANQAERVDGNVTVFEEAGYTACYSCRKRPDQAPTWAIKARRVVVKEDEKTLRFEEPRFEFFGVSSPVLPSFTVPDPSVRRKSGFLVPSAAYNNLLGYGVRGSYFQTLGPYRDITYGVTPLTRQGVFGDIEYRQRTATGGFQIRGTGIYQLDPEAFERSGRRRWRGSIASEGNLFLNPRWQWGWDTTATTDRRYLNDYQQTSGEFFTEPTTLYLNGLGERNFFDARVWAFRILQDDYNSRLVLDPPAPFSGVGSNLQGKQAYVHPIIDYEGIVDGAILGGELSYAINTTWLSRQETDAFGSMVDGTTVARFRGVQGTFGRVSGEVEWRRRMFAPLGQVITPFAGLRTDLFYIDNRDPNVFELGEDDARVRAMPWAGVNYRYPWLVAANWGTQTFEPIGEIIARPNETGIGSLPNDDAQSVVFDDTNLFGPTKFSGYDRSAGGVRANVGFRYTLQTYTGGFLSTTFGQSYHLAGRNSYRIPDILDSTGESGLSSDRSDFVGDITLNTNGGLAVSANGRFDDETLAVERAEVSASARLGPVSSRVVYAFLAAQEDLGIVDDREEIHGAASVRVFDTVRVFGQMRYDLQNRDVVRNGVGVAYDDDALSVSLAYSEDRGGMPEDPLDRTVYLRVGLRTIGDTGVSTGLDN